MRVAVSVVLNGIGGEDHVGRARDSAGANSGTRAAVFVNIWVGGVVELASSICNQIAEADTGCRKRPPVPRAGVLCRA